MNCTAVRNLKRAKRTVEKEDIISKQILQYSNGEISRLSFIQTVSKKVCHKNYKTCQKINK
jgi:hypothetical protein